MTPQEVIDILKMFTTDKFQRCTSSEFDDAIYVAIEALEKQERTAYKRLHTRYTHGGRVRHDEFRCCNCGFTKEFVDGHTTQHKYCPECGRRITWEGIE